MKSILSVAEPASATDLTVLATVKGELGIEAATDRHDRTLAALIRAASGIVATYCNRSFAREDIVQTFWPEYGSAVVGVLVLGRHPVSAVATVTLDDTVIASTEYRLDESAGMLYRLDTAGYPSAWWFGKSAVIAFTAGYALLDGLPQGIERATVLLIKEFWSGRGRDPRVKAEEIPGLASYEYWVGQMGAPGALPPDVTALLDPHRAPNVG